MRKNLGSAGVLVFAVLVLGGEFVSRDGFSQDYIETPSETQNSGGTSSSGSSGSGKKEIQLETEYEKRLRENIQNQLKQQSASSSASTSSDDSSETTSSTGSSTTSSTSTASVNCGTVSSTVISISDAVTEAAGGDSSVGRQAGASMTALIKSISSSYSDLPSEVGCADGAMVTNIESDAKQAFQNEFLRQCNTMVQEAQAAIEQGGISGFNSYISAKLSSMSNSTLNSAVNTACTTRGTYSSASSSGSGSSGSSGSGTTTTVVEQTTTTTSQAGSYNTAGGQSYIPTDDGTAAKVDPAPQQSLPPIDPSHNDNPPNVSYGEDARWLALRSAHEANNYAKCVFSANNSIVPECKRKFDKVLWDRRAQVVQSIDAGTYLILSEICKRGEGKGCKEGDSDYIQINSGYRSPATNAAVGGAKSSLHMKAQAVDFVIPGMSPSKSYDQCMQLGKGGCGKYGTFTHEDTGAKRSWSG